MKLKLGQKVKIKSTVSDFVFEYLIVKADDGMYTFLDMENYRISSKRFKTLDELAEKEGF